MTKNEFLSALRTGLEGLPEKDIEERVSFYAEMIDDRTEEGLTEEEAVDAVGQIDQVILQIREEIPTIAAKSKRERRNPIVQILKRFFGDSSVSVQINGEKIVNTMMSGETEGVVFITSEYEFEEAFVDIEISVRDADVIFAPSDDDKCRVVVFEREDEPHTVTVSGGTLTVRSFDDARGNVIATNTKSAPKVTVYLPENDYGALKILGGAGDVCVPDDFAFESVDISVSAGDIIMNASVSETLKINSSAGDISVSGITARDIDLSVSSGDVALSDVNCKGTVRITSNTGDVDVSDLTCTGFVAEGDAGDVTLRNVTASETITADVRVGDVAILESDAAALSLKTKAGDIKGSLRTDKVYDVSTSFGDISVPDTSLGGKCRIRTSTGDVCFW